MALSGSTPSPSDFIEAGYQALEHGDWKAGRKHFQAAVDLEATVEALEGLGLAAWWLDDAPLVFDNHERAYRRYRRAGERLGAGRMATWLGLHHYVFRGDLAITNGWLQRAQRLLEGLEPCAEQGWLALWSAHIALLERNDVATAKQLSAATIALAQPLGAIDLEMLALALEGLALVSEGRVSEGMHRLDESTTAALSGEMCDPDAIVTACCYLIYACERVRDYDRSDQWCRKAEEVARRWSYPSMFAFCRTHYAAVLIWRGDWRRAEAELTTATRDLMARRPGWAPESIVRLAELRRQGRSEDAAGLFGQVPAHPHALLGMAELALERGDFPAAADLVERFLRRVPPEDVTERASGLEFAVRSAIALGNIEQARAALDQLEAAAGAVGMEPLQGFASFARGMFLAATCDVDAARRCFEDAVDLFCSSGGLFETARARVELARMLAGAGRHDAATAQANEALNTFRQLGAEGEATRTVALLRELGCSPADARNGADAPAGLTRREMEVLGLLGSGYSNQQIGEQLFISVRTVERHISTIYDKIGAAGSAARAIATAYAIEHSLARPPRS